MGVLDINPQSLLAGDREQWEVFFISRLPRLLAILCTGVGMSVAGLIMQQLCSNKFVSPTTGATISSAQFGILLALLFMPSSTLWSRALFAFACAILGTWVFVWFIQRIQFKDVVMVPLVGIMFGNVIGGITNYLSYKYEMTQAMSSWLVGHFSIVLSGNYELVWLSVPLVVLAFVFANHFNIVGMGKDFSKNLGVPYNLVLFLGLSIAAMITASVVVVVGSISYIGLIVPNIVAMFKGDKIRGTLVDTALFGAIFVLVCDMIARVVIAPYELPIDHRQRFVHRPAALPLKARAQGHPPGGSPQRRLRLCRLPRGRGEGPMRSATYRANLLKLGVMGILVLAACAAYLLVDINPKYFDYAMSLRVPKLIVMLIAAFAIGGASLVFQSVINNTIVTPCLLGMNSLYTLIHTAVVFVAGSGSILAVNANAAFAVDLIIMGLSATVIYGYLFKKTNYNVLYVLLIGTVLTSFFGSIQSTLTRVMDPNEYDSLLSTLVASFSNVNAEIILFSLVVLALLVFFLRRDLALLDVLTLGKEQAINLGVDYDRSVRRLLLGVTLAIAVATAVVGPISFMGLIIANLSRQLLKTYRHTQLIAGSVLFGMVILVAGQLIVEHVYTYSIPISVFITVGGGVYFLYLLLTRRRV